MADREEEGSGTSLDETQQTDVAPADIAEPEEGDEADKMEPLNLEVQIAQPSACQRHITVTIPPEDIQKFFDKKFSELMPTAQVPGFRPGRAPRKLVESRFRKEVGEQVKSELLVASLTQINEQHELAAISEPDFDLDAIEMPADGPLKFEFDLEVRPEFDLPEWKGLDLQKPVYRYTEKDVDRRVREMISQFGHLVPHDGPAESGDYINCNLSFIHNGQQVSRSDEETIRLRPVLSFRDGRIEKFDKQMAGVKANETWKIEATISPDAPNEALRGQKVTAVFEVLEVKKLELPELTPEFLHELGEFDDEADFRKAVRVHLERQLEYHQRQRAREQITAKLVREANWDLPAKMLQRQTAREIERHVMELRRNGFSDDRIRQHANELRQNSMASTAKALKEHFILERIAEEEKIEAEPADYDHEIDLIADQSNESPRRVRARLEKRGLMDVLRNQIIEHKVIDLVLGHAKFTEVPYQPAGADTDAEAVDYSAGGGDRGEDIPTATKPGEPESLKNPDSHG